MSNKSGRYETSFLGLIGAMIITVAAVLGVIGFRQFFANDVEIGVTAVDWRESVELAESADLAVAHPDEIPEGWVATSVDLVAVGRTQWGLGMLTDDEKFVGIRQTNDSVRTLVSEYVDEKAERGEDTTIDSAVATTWETWTDEGGDTGYAVDIDGTAILVYGSAPVEDITAIVETLVR